MRKSEMNSLVAGVKIQSKKDSTVYEIVGLDKEQQKAILTDGKVYSFSTLYRWFNLYVEPVAEEKEDTEEQDTTADTDTTTQDTDTTATTATNIQVNELHEDNDKTTKTHTTEANTGTDDKITSEDIIYIIEHSNCDAVVKKQYIGAYKENYKGAVCMVRTTRKGNTHIDIKQGIFNSLAESIRTKLQTKYAARVYDSTRGYIRLFEVDDLAVLQDLILFVLGIA